MVEVSQRRFCELPHGQNNARIEGTTGSLLTLPVVTNSELQYQLIACNGPLKDTQLSFWRDLVLDYKVPLVINLCETVGNSGNWWNGCCWYWPTTVEPLVIESDKLVVKMESMQELCSTLTQYRLLVKHVQDDGNERTASVILMHFKGWPDMTVPGAGDDSDVRTNNIITRAQQTEGYNTMLLNLVNFYGQLNSKKAIIHCRSGQGRTGTTITILTRILQSLHGTEASLS